MVSPEPLIFSLQHFCVHDGPGIRSLVFFKGCPLRCVWCQNVESWKTEAEIGFKAHLCIACGRCVERCPERAIAGPGQRDANRCRLCFTCVQGCPSGAMTRFGVKRTPEETVAELRPEFPLLRGSGGGVTLTGGEPTLFPEFAVELARLLRSEDIPVALETCGLFNLGRLRPLLAELQLVLFDIKVCDREQHRLLCGSENTVIKGNLRSLAQAARMGEGPPVWPRLPLVPGMTDGPANIRSWAGLLRDAGAPFITIIPYHQMGRVKRAWLGLPAGPDLRVPGDGEIAAAAELFASEGIRAFRPGEEDFWGETTAGLASTSP
jgi:pyruvate formate lyase activating enzyme